MKPLKPSLKTSLARHTRRYEQNLPVAEAYLAGRGITPDTAATYRLGVVIDPAPEHEPADGRLAIPSIGPDGDIRSLRFRSLDGAEPKYWAPAGEETRLYNPRAIATAGDLLCITEGEIDCLTLDMLGFPSVGVTGATSWKPHYARCVAGFDRVFVLGDGDKAGRDFARRVVKDLPNGVPVILPSGTDVNSLFVDEGEESVMAMLADAGWDCD